MTAPRVAWPALLMKGGDGGNPRANETNAVIVLQHDPQWGPDYVWYDEFIDRVMRRDGDTVREWRDTDDTALALAIQAESGPHIHNMTESIAARAVRYVARQRVRHCVRDSIVEWDDEPRIDPALERYWGVEPGESQPQAYVRAVSRNLFLCLAARILHPGCQVDNMVVLEGPQGIGKSRSLRALGGAHYLLATESFDSKDFLQSIIGALVVEIGELDAMNRARVERWKGVMTSTVDKFRGAYERHVRAHPRRCIFIGTTNRGDYGADETGLRRVWPVRCSAIDVEALTEDREQLLAEAVVRVRAGEPWWTTPPEETLTIQADRQYEDPWAMTVLNWVTGKDDVHSTEVLTGALSLREADISRLEQHRVSAILQLAGWTRQTVRRSGQRPFKGYKSPD